MIPGMTLTLPDLVVPSRALPERPVTRPYEAALHRNDTLSVLLRVRDEGTYPPVTGKTINAFADWLTRDPVQASFVALVEGKVAGHIAVSAPRPALASDLARAGKRSIASNGYCEITKLFVAPELQGHGIGRALVSAARGHAWANAQQPVIAVPEELEEAHRFCAGRGLTDNGAFGSARVLIDEAPPWFIASW